MTPSLRVTHLHQRIGGRGGPNGYLANLRAGIEEFGAPHNVAFAFVELPQPVPSPAASPAHPLVDRLRHAARYRWRRLAKSDREIRFEEQYAAWRPDYAWVGLTDARRLFECDLLFVHDVCLAQRLVQLLPIESRDRLLLMTHSPATHVEEFAEHAYPDIGRDELRVLRPVNVWNQRDVQTMMAIRTVVWPSPGAQQGYREWNALYKAGQTRPTFVLTGVPRPIAAGTRDTVRASWNVAPESKVILFMGRPHPHKGYLRFVDWADWYREQGRAEWVFVHAGDAPTRTQRDVSSLRHVGYQSDHAGAYLAAELTVFPNERAFMDIGLLECLGLGGRLAMTPIGGHEDIAHLCPEIPLIPDGTAQEVCARLIATANAFAERPETTAAFETLWRDQFSLRPFVEHHAAAMRHLGA